jgi:hypothetical protein
MARRAATYFALSMGDSSAGILGSVSVASVVGPYLAKAAIRREG